MFGEESECIFMQETHQSDSRHFDNLLIGKVLMALRSNTLGSTRLGMVGCSTMWEPIQKDLRNGRGDDSSGTANKGIPEPKKETGIRMQDMYI